MFRKQAIKLKFDIVNYGKDEKKVKIDDIEYYPE